MIKINLLKAAATAPVVASGVEIDSSGQVVESGFDPAQVQRRALVNLVIILIGPLSMYLYEGQTLPDLRIKLQQKNQQLAEIAAYNAKNEAAVKEIQKFESDRDNIQKQIKFLEAISQQRLKEIMVLDLIQRTIPEKTWLQKLTITNETPPPAAGSAPAKSGEIKIPVKNFSLNGYSLSDSEVLDFTERLQRSTIVENVIPKKTVDSVMEKTTVKEFVIEGKVANR